jgi:REP element-mobilizing transposase RayT
MTYLITFTCYGCHLHGHKSGSVDRNHRLAGSPLLEADPRRVSAEQLLMCEPAYTLDRVRQTVVLKALREVCLHRGWILLAAHVRTTHVHVVVEAEVKAERIMNDFKSYASRCLTRSGLDHPDRKRWTRHGSTRWLWKEENVSAAIRYVIEAQGEPMAVFQG